jgi:protein-S-isoprenylcysteine O-methyltransferase Ste14
MLTVLGFFDTWTSFWVQARVAILAAAGVMLLVATIGIGIVRRSLLAAFGTLVFGALLWMLMYRANTVRDSFEDDLIDGAGAEFVVPAGGHG